MNGISKKNQQAFLVAVLARFSSVSLLHVVIVKAPEHAKQAMLLEWKGDKDNAGIELKSLGISLLYGPTGAFFVFET